MQDLIYPKLKYEWSVWEIYTREDNQRRDEEYLSNMGCIHGFDTLENFALFWNNLPHSTPSKFFYKKPDRAINKLQLSQSVMKQFESIAIFKKDISPSWEDIKNKDGGYFHLVIKDAYPDDVDHFWKCVVFDLIGGDLGEFEDHINGIRIVDKTNEKGFQVRIEVWIDDQNKKELQEQLGNRLRELYCSGKDSKLGTKVNPRPRWIPFNV